MSSSQLGESLESRVVDIDSVIPYWRNPRRITEEAVNAVAESIRRYGYLQPIVVDSEMCIILGHTRYGALRRLGAKKIEVGVAAGLTPERVKQLRVLDNRVAEYNRWDLDKLVDELGKLDAELMYSYFPEFLQPFEDEADSTLTIHRDGGGVDGNGHALDNNAEFVCPSCFHSWEQEVTNAQIMRGKIGQKS